MSEGVSKPGSISEQRAEQFAGTLHYHLKMVGELIPWMTHFDSNGPAILKNACLESFLTHVRLLIEFIAGRPDGKDSLHRKRSTRDLQPKTLGLSNWGITVPNYFDAQLDLMDKHLSHLSLERVSSSSGRLWAVEQIANPLLAEYGNLADQLRAQGNKRCADPISSGVSEAVVLMKRTIQSRTY